MALADSLQSYWKLDGDSNDALTQTSTFYPDANPETTTVDGGVLRGSVDQAFSDIRGGAGTGHTDSETDMMVNILASTTSNQYQELQRCILLFDTSAIPDSATIISAKLYFYIRAKTDGLSAGSSDNSKVICVASTPASNTDLVNADYAELGTTSFGESAKQDDLTESAFNSITLNATGLAAISTNGITKLGLRYKFDVDNTTTGITWASGQRIQLQLDTSDQGVNKPYLEVTYSNDGTDTDVSYTQFEFYNGTPDNQQTINGANWKAQTFTPSTSHSITSVKIKVYRVDTPGTATVAIYATSGGVPTGSPLVSNTFDADAITTNSAGEWVTITLSATALVASTKYAIVVSAPDAGSDTLNWKNDYEGTYTGGSLCTSANSGTDWSANTDYDQVFFEYGTGTSGKINQGAGFNGSTSKIVGSTINIPANCSISCWFKTSQTTEFPRFVSFTGAGEIPNFEVGQINGGGQVYAYLRDSDSVVLQADSDSTALNDGAWHHAVAVKTGSGAGATLKLYIDGVLQVTDDTDDLTGNFNSMVTAMGIRNGGSNYMTGSIDEVGIWERALSSTEVTTLYNGGSGLQYPFGQTISVSESVNFTESQIENMNIARSESPSFTETMYGNLNTSKSESVTFTETAKENMSIVKSESVTFLERLLVNPLKVLLRGVLRATMSATSKIKNLSPKSKTKNISITSKLR